MNYNNNHNNNNRQSYQICGMEALQLHLVRLTNHNHTYNNNNNDDDKWSAVSHSVEAVVPCNRRNIYLWLFVSSVPNYILQRLNGNSLSIDCLCGTLLFDHVH